jgi:hypothetical protein
MFQNVGRPHSDLILAYIYAIVTFSMAADGFQIITQQPHVDMLWNR